MNKDLYLDGDLKYSQTLRFRQILLTPGDFQCLDNPRYAIFLTDLPENDPHSWNTLALRMATPNTF